MKTSSGKGAGFIFIAGSLWGTIGLFVTIMNRQGSFPALTGFLRLAFAFLLLFLFTARRYGLRAFLVDRKTLLFSVLLGLISHGINNWVYASSVTLNGVSLAVVILNLAPLFTLLWAVLIFSERLTEIKILAVAVNLTGCALAVTGGKFSGLSITIPGLLFGIGAAVTYSLNPILGRFATEKTNPYVVSTYCFFVAAVFLAFLAKPWNPSISWNVPLVASGLLYALIATAIAFVFYYTGVRMITTSSRIPIIASVEIIVATAVGVLVFSEPIGLPHLAGILLILSSILLLNLPLSQKIKTG